MLEQQNTVEPKGTIIVSGSGNETFSTLKQLKGRPRGRPWPPGTSGNPAGRKKGCLAIFTRIIQGVAAAKAEQAPPPRDPDELNPDYPFCERGKFFIQRGRKFFIDTKKAVPGPIPPPPEFFDKRRQKWGYELIFKGRQCLFTQNGWVYDRQTLQVVL